jgi:hypothetical protein
MGGAAAPAGDAKTPAPLYAAGAFGFGGAPATFDPTSKTTTTTATPAPAAGGFSFGGGPTIKQLWKRMRLNL